MDGPLQQQTEELFVSGRLCLFGEHSDWAGEYRMHEPDIQEGKTIVVGTKEGLKATAAAASSSVLTITVTTDSGEVLGPRSFLLKPKDLLEEARKGGFWSYVAGTAYRVVVNHKVSGLVIDNYKTTLPMGKGLSSSAAICVLIARAFNLVYDLKLTIRGEMELAYLGEITTPSRCGRMDQACAYGSIPVLMTFDADILHVEPVVLRESLHLVLVDLKAAKNTTAILKALQEAYPKPATEADRRLHALLGTTNHHVVSRAVDAMKQGQVALLGELMREAQRHFDECATPLCPEQLTAPVLHRVLHYPAIQPLIYGGKGVGSQGDGTAQLLAKGPEEQAQVCEILASEFGMHCLPLTVEANMATL